MPIVDQETRQQRVELVYRLVERHPGGITEQDIAASLNMQRRTVNNYLRELEIQGKVYRDARLWYLLPTRRTTLRRFELSPEEAMTLYLATRLLVKQQDERNESAESALVKLAEVLTGDVGVGREIHQAALELAQRPGDPLYSRVFRTVMQGYIYRRKVAITYRPLNRRPFDTLIAPYLLEPSAVGYTTYVIGHSSIVNALRTYKLERIGAATLTADEYEVPPDFPGLDYLRHAWSIFAGEETVDVALRFSPAVTPRVRESRWHPSQQIEADPDRPGGCIWRAQVADLTDLMPWVRGWGAEVEVLDPPELRLSLVSEARRLGTVYGLQPIPLFQRLWAKAGRRRAPGPTHALVCHMLDVGLVARALWRQALTDSMRGHFAHALGLEIPDAERLIAFWAALHDLGKATPAFQRKVEWMAHVLEHAGLAFPRLYARETYDHGVGSARLLQSILPQRFKTPLPFTHAVAKALGGHHGDWPIAAELRAATLTQQLGGPEWDDVRTALVDALNQAFEPPTGLEAPSDRTAVNGLVTLLSGFVTVADWIGSMEDYFPYTEGPIDPATYAVQAYECAQRALRELDWEQWTPPATEVEFSELFGLPSPRPTQRAVMARADTLVPPALVLIEAPTGVGKTEAALYLADQWARVAQQRGLYVAMPTRATSDQMHGRVTQVLQRRYPDLAVAPMLIHGLSRWSQHGSAPEIAQEDAGVTSGAELSAESMRWFLPRKRSLLAPFAVGTVDQALLAVLQTRHFFVRLFGLSHKTVIFDEVHAYDTYMSELFLRLINWLRAVGASVVVLSATLPESARRDIVQAYSGRDPECLEPTPYPRITWVMDVEVVSEHVPHTDERCVTLTRIGSAADDIANFLSAILSEGGCAAVICNTVRRAQSVYSRLRECDIVPPDDLILYHARFPNGWRAEIEKRVLSRFGRDGARRPERAIVVATQVIEQSLDLDFDVMVTDPAPVDLLIQRAGRMHRHDRPCRPTPLATAQLALAYPLLDERGVPQWDAGDAYVYEPYILLRTHLALDGRDRLRLPSDTQALIGAVYDDEEPGDLATAMAAALVDARSRSIRGDARATAEARGRMVSAVCDERLLDHRSALLKEDSPEAHDALRALTRLSPRGVTLVCLHAIGGGLMTDPDHGLSVDLDQPPDDAVTRALVAASLDVSSWPIVHHFVSQPTPTGWKRHPLLRDCRPAVFTDGECSLPGTDRRLRLDRDRGLALNGGEDESNE